MRVSKRSALAITTSLVLAFAGSAHAEATIDTDVAAKVLKGTKFVVSADVTMTNKGVVTLTGAVGTTPFSLTKKFKTKAGKSRTKTIKFVVDPKKLGIRDEPNALLLQAQMSAAEDGQEAPAVAGAGAILPLPVMIVPGLGNELSAEAFKKIYFPFRDALNENAGSPWITKGRRATIVVQRYFSTSFPLEVLGAQIAKQGAKLIKKSRSFARIDMIGQSTGGLVIRQAMAPLALAKAPRSLAGKVRHVVFMGSPQSGTPVAFLAQTALEATRDLPNGARQAALEAIKARLVGDVDSPSAASLADLLLVPARKPGQDPPFLGVVQLFLPSYPFASVPLPGGGTIELDLASLTADPGPSQTAPLSVLNAAAPDPDTTYHALYYTDVAEATGDVRTVDGLDFVAFILGGSTDSTLITTLNGSGDGVASVRSTLMTAHAPWNAVLRPVPLGAGLQSVDATRPALPAYYNDPNVIGYILKTLFPPPEM